MAAVSIDLDAQIENLRGFKTDLEECYWDAADGEQPRRCYAIGVALTQLTQRIAALEDVVRHHGGDVVSVATLSVDESRALTRALNVLDGELVGDQAEDESRLWNRVRTLLAAVDDLLLTVARGERTSEDEDGGRHPCVVLTLARSSR